MAGTALRLATSAALLATLALPLAAQRPGDRLLVCNKSADTVSVFDAVTRAEIATLPTGEAPHEIAVSPDGCTAVVTNYGRQRAGRTLTILDVPGAAVRGTLRLAGDPCQQQLGQFAAVRFQAALLQGYFLGQQLQKLLGR